MSGVWLLFVLWSDVVLSCRAVSIGDGIPPLQGEVLIANISDDGIPPLQGEVLVENFSDDGIPTLQGEPLPKNLRDAVIPPPSRP